MISKGYLPLLMGTKISVLINVDFSAGETLVFFAVLNKWLRVNFTCQTARSVRAFTPLFVIAVYDVVEEKLESEPDFQYIPEKSPLDGVHQDDNALRESMIQLAEGLITGTVLAQFDVSTVSPVAVCKFQVFWDSDYFKQSRFQLHFSRVSIF